VRAFLAGLVTVIAIAGGITGAVMSAGTDEPPRDDPLLSLVATPTPDPDLNFIDAWRDEVSRGIYGMYTPDADRAVHAMVTDLIEDIRAGRLRSSYAVRRAMDRGIARLDASGYSEVTDTVVREHITLAIMPVMASAGIDTSMS
jgi:hypothetical protein